MQPVQPAAPCTADCSAAQLKRLHSSTFTAATTLSDIPLAALQRSPAVACTLPHKNAMAVCRAALVAALLNCIPALSAAVRAPPVHALYCADALDAPAFFDSASVRDAVVQAPLAIQRVALASSQPFHLR